MKKYIERIIEIRKSKGLMQKQIADKLGMTQVSYSKIETGKTDLTIDKLFKIATILEVNIIELIYPEYLEPNFDRELQLENERLKMQIENLKESAKKDSQIVEYSTRFNISIKKAMLMALDSSFTHISHNIMRHEKEEQEMKLESLYDFSSHLKKNLIELGVFVDSDFEWVEIIGNGKKL